MAMLGGKIGKDKCVDFLASMASAKKKRQASNVVESIWES